MLVLPSCLMMLAQAPGAETEWRKWTSGTGSVIEGKIAELIPNPRDMMNAKVKLETRDGRVITVSFNQLSAVDQAWVANHHGNELAGKAPEKPAPSPATGGEARLFPVKPVACFEPESLLTPPAGTSFNRREIPSRGPYEDQSSDGANLVTNHLFWLCKAGYLKMEIGRDEDDAWQKIQKNVSRRFRGGKSWQTETVAALAIEMIQRECKGVTSIRPWKPSMITPSFLDAFDGSPAMVLFECKALRRDKYEWSYVAPLLEATGRDLTFFYQGERIRTRIEDRAATRGSSGVKLPDGRLHHGYQMVFDPGDQSNLATRLRKEELAFVVDPGSFYVIDLELTPPATAKP